MKPESVMRATRLIRTGEMIELGHVLNASMPIYGPRRFDLFTKRTSSNTGINQRGGNELIVSEIKQDPMLVGADNSGVEIDPSTDPKLNGPVHQIFLVVPSCREPHTRRPGGDADLRVRVLPVAAQDSGRHGFPGGPDRDSLRRLQR